MKFPEDLLYLKKHTWLKMDTGMRIKIEITSKEAASQLLSAHSYAQETVN